MSARRSVLRDRAPLDADRDSEEVPFWKRKRLDEMTRTEWELLCDGCGKCCLVKLEYLDTGEIEHSKIACRLLDLKSCRCSDYPNRQRKVKDCLKLTPRRVAALNWLPASCAYRLVAEGRDLYWWHPLVSGDPETVHVAGVSVRGRVISEAKGREPDDHIVDWIDDTGLARRPKARKMAAVGSRKSARGRGTT